MCLSNIEGGRGFKYMKNSTIIIIKVCCERNVNDCKKFIKTHFFHKTQISKYVPAHNDWRVSPRYHQEE